MKLSSDTSLLSLLGNPFRVKLFFIRHLPMAFLAGLRIVSADNHHATVSLPYKYLTKNPFRSIYFACQAMAAEFSTGIMCLQALQEFDEDISLLVVEVKAEFLKKATETVSFTCEDDNSIVRSLKECVEQKESRSIILHSTGTDSSGETVAKFKITWSFKPRS